jgi:hypothetical protein
MTLKSGHKHITSIYTYANIKKNRKSKYENYEFRNTDDDKLNITQYIAQREVQPHRVNNRNQTNLLTSNTVANKSFTCSLEHKPYSHNTAFY